MVPFNSVTAIDLHKISVLQPFLFQHGSYSYASVKFSCIKTHKNIHSFNAYNFCTQKKVDCRLSVILDKFNSFTLEEIQLIYKFLGNISNYPMILGVSCGIWDKIKE
jgi:hypothetical protein